MTADHTPTLSSAPQIAETDRRSICAQCGDRFNPGRIGQRFCNPKSARVAPCALAWGRVNTARGGPVVPVLQAWAMTRHAKPGTREAEINRYARRFLTDAARHMNAQDAESPRASVLEYVGGLMDSREIYADRVG